MSSEEPTEQGVEITNYAGPDEAGQAASVSPTHKADADWPLSTRIAFSASPGQVSPTHKTDADWPPSTPRRQHQDNGGCLASIVFIGICCVLANFSIFFVFYFFCLDICPPHPWWLLQAMIMLAVIGVGANIWGLVKHGVQLSPLPAMVFSMFIIISMGINLLFFVVAIPMLFR